MGQAGGAVLRSTGVPPVFFSWNRGQRHCPTINLREFNRRWTRIDAAKRTRKQVSIDPASIRPTLSIVEGKVNDSKDGFVVVGLIHRPTAAARKFRVFEGVTSSHGASGCQQLFASRARRPGSQERAVSPSITQGATALYLGTAHWGRSSIVYSFTRISPSRRI